MSRHRLEGKQPRRWAGLFLCLLAGLAGIDCQRAPKGSAAEAQAPFDAALLDAGVPDGGTDLAPAAAVPRHPLSDAQLAERWNRLPGVIKARATVQRQLARLAEVDEVQVSELAGDYVYGLVEPARDSRGKLAPDERDFSDVLATRGLPRGAARALAAALKAVPFDVCGGRFGFFDPSYRIRFFSRGKLLVEVRPREDCRTMDFSTATQERIQCKAMTEMPELKELCRQLASLFPWKGDVHPVSWQIRDIRGPASSDKMGEAMDRLRYGLEFCYERELVRRPGLAGEATVEVSLPAMAINRWRQGPDPYPASSVRLLSSTLKRPRLERCLVRVLGRRADWPKSSEPVVVTVALQLKFLFDPAAFSGLHP